MNRFGKSKRLGLLIGSILVLLPLLASAQESNLPQKQSSVATRYERLEELLLRLAEMEGSENPERAALLRRAARQSRDQFVLNRLQGASEALMNQRFQEAVDKQTSATEGLEGLLQLLMSEDRSKRIRDEKERIANLIKDLKRVERSERSTRARTENGADMKEVQAEQRAITERSEALRTDLAENDAADDSSTADSAQSESAQSESAQSDSDDSQEKAATENEGKERQESGKEADLESDADSESKNDSESGGEKDAQPMKAETPQSETPASESQGQSPESSGEQQAPQESGEQQPPSESQSSESQPSESQPSESQPSESQPSDAESPQSPPENTPDSPPQTPQQLAEQQLQQAIEKMKEAEKELEQSKRTAATERQREAEENLRAAIDRLEQILRQLREEEMQRELAKLESRLRRMAAMQSKVFEDTVALASTPKSQRNRQTDLKAGDLAFEEKKITMEADRAMLLLREEGSSVAFPEVVSQIRLDTTVVAERLGETKIDAVTQGIQQDILAALEEMIAALQKAQRDLEEQRQQQEGQPQQGGQGEQPLVEALAELKLIRTMETRIKSSTSRYADLLDTGESSVTETLPLLQDLAERQNRLYGITRDLVQKRNQ